MSELNNAWNRARLRYQQRYVKQLKEATHSQLALGHLLECSFVLTDVLGLSVRQIEELELPNSCGLTKADWESERKEEQKVCRLDNLV